MCSTPLHGILNFQGKEPDIKLFGGQVDIKLFGGQVIEGVVYSIYR